MWSSGLK
jgi:hypothetical protein